MRSMFFKLFLGFWLTMVLGGMISVAVVSMYRHFSVERLRNDMSKSFDDNLSKLIVLSGQAAWDMYRCGGQAEYENYINGLATGARTRINLIGTDNKTIDGDKITDRFVDLAEAARRNPGVFTQKSGETLTVVKQLPEKEGESVVVIGEHVFGPPPRGMPPPPHGRHPPLMNRVLPPFFGSGEIIRAAIMLVVASAVCYLLARSLTQPIRKLQKTTQQIASGDYSARVGDRLGRHGSEITNLGRDFDVMVERTEKTINSQKRLLRDISHELRSPLARLTVALELAKKNFGVEDDRCLNKIGREVERLNELIGHLLILARLESGAAPHTIQPVDLADLVKEVAEDVDFEAAGNNRGVKIVSSCDITVTGSRELLRRAIENIVRNAAQYTAQNTLVEIELYADKKEARIGVADYGPGVPDWDLPHLFEPFYRVAEARERQSGGVGIGLAIAEQAVKAHGGSVTAQNAEGKMGLIVTIILPLQS